MTPYNTGKVQIGLLYEPPPPQPDSDMVRLQRAMCRRSHRITYTTKREARKTAVESVLWCAALAMLVVVIYSPAIASIIK